MQLTIDVRLNNGDPCRVVYEDGAVRKFNIEIPGTSEDQVNEAKLIQAAQGLAAYEDVIPSLINELNQALEAERNKNDKNEELQPPPEEIKVTEGASTDEPDENPLGTTVAELTKDFDDSVKSTGTLQDQSAQAAAERLFGGGGVPA